MTFTGIAEMMVDLRKYAIAFFEAALVADCEGETGDWIRGHRLPQPQQHILSVLVLRKRLLPPAVLHSPRRLEDL